MWHRKWLILLGPQESSPIFRRTPDVVPLNVKTTSFENRLHLNQAVDHNQQQIFVRSLRLSSFKMSPAQVEPKDSHARTSTPHGT